MLALIVACFASADWVPPDRPGLVTRIGSPAFRLFGARDSRHNLLATSPDGKRLYTGNFQGIRGSLSRVHVWDTATGRIVASYDPRGGSDRVASFRFATDGLRIIIDIRDESIPFDGKHRGRIPRSEKEPLVHVWDWQQFRLLDPDTGRVRREGKPWLPVPSESEDCIDEWVADGWLLSRGKDTCLADPETGKLTSFDPGIGEKSWVHAVAPDGRTALVMTGDEKVRLHDFPGGKACAE